MECKYTKKCKNHCPNCGASSDEIEWGMMETDDPPYYEGYCTKCGTEFHEVFEYSYTTFDEIKPQTTMSDEEIEEILNTQDNTEEWPEFEQMKDACEEFFGNLPTEVYEHLLPATQKEIDRLIEYLLKYPLTEKDKNDYSRKKEKF